MKMSEKKLGLQSLCEENKRYEGTAGVSEGNRSSGFIPAFMDEATGTAYPSRFENGELAPVHLFDGLPEVLVKRSIITGRVYALRDGLISGFLFGKRFYTRSEAAMAVSQQ